MSDETKESDSAETGIRTVSESLEPLKVEHPTPPAPEATVRPARPGRKRPWVVYLFIFIFAFIVFAAVGGYLYIKYEKGKTEDAYNLVAKGKSAMSESNLFNAGFQFERALELDEEIPGAHAGLGEIAIAYKQPENAVMHFQAELEFHPDNRTSHMGLGCLYTLACLPEGDPKEMSGYLLEKFTEVIPLTWPADLTYSVDPDFNPVMKAVYHFLTVSENQPDDARSQLGLALTEIAMYQLVSARERLSQVITSANDPSILAIADQLIDDINREEMYFSLQMSAPSATTGYNGMDYTGLMDNPDPDFTTPPEGMPDLSAPPASMPGSMVQTTGRAGGFGSSLLEEFIPQSDDGGDHNLGVTLTPEHFVPVPRVKPVSDGFFSPETHEYISVIRIANSNQQGERGCIEGETITMPETGYVVKILEKSEDRIVLEENNSTFVFVPAQVGWTVQTALDGINLDPALYTPGLEDETPDEDGDDVPDTGVSDSPVEE